jgi:hypothetical protein
MSSASPASFLQAGGGNMANMAAAAAAGLFGGPAGNPLAGMQHGLGSMGGFDQNLSGQNALSAENMLLQQQQSVSGSEGAGGGASAGVSGSGFAGLPGMVSGLTSSEAVYGTDGLDVPGSAQVRMICWLYLWCQHYDHGLQGGCGCHGGCRAGEVAETFFNCCQ